MDWNAVLPTTGDCHMLQLAQSVRISFWIMLKRFGTSSEYMTLPTNLCLFCWLMSRNRIGSEYVRTLGLHFMETHSFFLSLSLVTKHKVISTMLKKEYQSSQWGSQRHCTRRMTHKVIQCEELVSCAFWHWWSCASGICPTRTNCEQAFLHNFCNVSRKSDQRNGLLKQCSSSV